MPKAKTHSGVVGEVSAPVLFSFEVLMSHGGAFSPRASHQKVAHEAEG